MGITTTDGGEFVRRSVLTSDMNKNFVKRNFKSSIRVGTRGGGFEKGLASAEKAIKLNKKRRSRNYKFLRDDAFLAVIIVSDENDISHLATKHYIDKILTAKSDAKRVAIYSIVDTKTESYPDPFYKPINERLYTSEWINPGGLRYMNASDYTGGFYADIHKDFSDSLLSIGSDIVELTKSFRLGYTPIINTINVKVNGVANTSWFYNDDTSSVEFSITPPEGADIEISYKYIQ
jgi:hypothetical protein